MAYEEILKQSYEKAIKEYDILFQTHETFMLRLCEILKLDYVEATEEDVLRRVKILHEFRIKILESNYYTDDERQE